VVPLVAGKLLGLDREQMVNAVGISGSTNHALRTPGSRSMMKAMGFPLVAKNGIDAVLMAQKGLTGPKSVIETMNHTIGHDADLTPLIRGGEKLRILSSKIKPYAAAGKIQPSLTALFSLLERHSIQAEEVEAVTVRTYEVARAQVAAPEAYQPANKESADQSLPYCIAVALIERALGPRQFREGRWRDPQVLALMAKVTVLTDPEFDKIYPATLPADVEILTKQGERFRARVDYPQGDLRNPVTDEEVEKKFRGLVSPLTTEARVSRIIEMVNRIEEVNDIGELMELLVL
jgi:2-methylcitrate dehydratase